MMIRKSACLTIMALTTLAITSCKEDYFDAERYHEIVKESFPVANVDPQHTWSTIESASVQVTVSLNDSETYRLKIYDQSPLGKPKDLTLLGEGSVRSGQTFTTTISYPTAQPYVFVALFDKQNYMKVYPMGITDGKIEGLISSQAAATARRNRVIASNFQFASAPADADFKTAIPDDALLPSAYGDATKGSLHNYKLAETTETQSTNFHAGNFALYVSGTKNISFTQPGDGSKNMLFYVLPGAHLTFKNQAFTLNGRENFKMYVAPGATVTFEQGLQSYMQLYNRGTVNVRGGYKPGIYGNGVFYNEGAFNIDGAQGYYAAPENINNPLTLNNEGSQFINAGRLNVGGIVIEGSSHFLNLDTVNVAGATIVNSNNCTWINNGHYVTDRFRYTAGSTDVINNCHLIVNDRFYINLGDTDKNSFQLDGGASVLTKDFEFSGPGFIKMGEGALFNVTGTAYMFITKDVYGLYGPATGGYAVFQAKHVVRRDSWQTNQGFVANYFGHLYVATDDHFNFGYSDVSASDYAEGKTGSQPYYRLDAASGAAMTGYGAADNHVTDNGCGAAYEGRPEEEDPQAEPLSLRYCFEDNFPQVGDYDFNDAVITLQPTINGTNVTLRVSLDAVGASEQIAAAIRIKGLKMSDLADYSREGNMDQNYPTQASIKIISTNDVLVPASKTTTDDVVINLFSNAHWTLGRTLATNGSVLNWFYNTVARTNTTFTSMRNDVEPAVVTYTFRLNDAAKAACFTKENLDVFIVEGYNGGYWEVHTVPFKTEEVLSEYASGQKAAYNDNMPWAICVPGNFRYPVEWQTIGSKDRSTGEITGAYAEPGHSFAEWATDHTKATDWYKYPTSGLVY